MNRRMVVVGIISLLFATSITPLVFGGYQNVDLHNLELINYNSYHVSEIKDTKYIEIKTHNLKLKTSNNNLNKDIQTNTNLKLPITLELMNSSWPTNSAKSHRQSAIMYATLGW